MARTTQDLFLTSLFYSGLVKFGPDLHVIPELAVSIPTVSGGGKVYTFTVRQDARFSSGRPCRAADVAFSLARALSPNLHSRLARSFLGNIVGATAVEEGRTGKLSGVVVTSALNLKIRLMHPDAEFLEKLAFPTSYVVDRRMLSRHVGRAVLGEPAGTGPWMLASGRPGGGMQLKPRPRSYGLPLHLKETDLVPVQTPADGLTTYRKASVDTALVPNDKVDGLLSNPDLHQSQGLEAYYALAGPGLRTKLDASLDRTSLIAAVGEGLSSLTTIVPPAVPDYVSTAPTNDSASPPPKLGSLHVHLVASRNDSPVTESLRRALGKQWPVTDGYGRPVRIIDVSFMLPDPEPWLAFFATYGHNAKYATALRQAVRLTNDPVSRMNAYATVESEMLGGRVIPLASGSVSYLFKPQLQGLQVTPLGLMPNNNAWSSVSVT